MVARLSNLRFALSLFALAGSAAAPDGPALAADPLRIIVFGAHPDDCELEAAGTAARWAALGHKVKFVAVTNGDIGHLEHGRRAPGPPPHRRGPAVRRDPRHRDRGARHPRRRADADAGEPPDDHPLIREWKADIVISPPAQRLPPRPPLHRHPGAGRRLHGHRPQLLPRRAPPRQEPRLPLLRGRLPEAQPVRARRRGGRSTPVLDQKLAGVDALESQFYEGGTPAGSSATSTRSPRGRPSGMEWTRKQLHRALRQDRRHVPRSN